jgi:hypothetical protein
MFTECALWRTHTLAKIAAIHPDLAIVSNLSDRTIVASNGMAYPVAQAQVVWEAGLALTLVRLAQVARQVAMINDTPASQYDVPVCLSEHRDSILACSTPPSKAVEPGWVRATADGTRAAGAVLVDPTLWVCPSTPCPPVIGNFLVFRDTNHLSAPFAEALAPRLGAAISAFSAAAGQLPVP